MPDIVTHYRLGAAALSLLSPELRAKIFRPIFDHATAGPDIWFSYRFWSGKRQEGKPERGNIMQHERTGEFLLCLARHAKESAAKSQLFSYLAGFLCHYALDRAAHPYIIYRSGTYDGTAATRAQRGNHMWLEHALDRRALRQWGKSLWSSPIVFRILRLRKLPASMRAGLDAAYREVYGWENAWADLNRGAHDQRRFYLLAQDPCGLLDAVLRRVDSGKGRDLTAISYHGKECAGVDIANKAHAPWRHPNDPSLEFSESFDDLLERAARDAAAMIEAGWAYLSGEASDPLASAFGNASYETGFDWRDPRNARKRECQPLDMKRHIQKEG